MNGVVLVGDGALVLHRRLRQQRIGTTWLATGRAGRQAGGGTRSTPLLSVALGTLCGGDGCAALQETKLVAEGPFSRPYRSSRRYSAAYAPGNARNALPTVNGRSSSRALVPRLL